MAGKPHGADRRQHQNDWLRGQRLPRLSQQREMHGRDIQDRSEQEQALRHAATALPDLVILDLGLPDLDGVEVTKRLREESAIPIIIVPSDSARKMRYSGDPRARVLRRTA